MYAVIRTGGKQHRVEKDDVVRVERLPGKVGGKVTFKEVLAVGENGKLQTGTPALPKAKVSGTIVEQGKGKKVRVFKFKKNSQYKIMRGHSQLYTSVKVTGISAE
ncbi:MAG: 50S ribosomal protein L21 [Terriglobia bacterium]